MRYLPPCEGTQRRRLDLFPRRDPCEAPLWHGGYTGYRVGVFQIRDDYPRSLVE